ncbi:MAG: O-methyltransferase [Acidobacteria bacterium]|nr:O-methyltransferase [Acidobacteriota bacterium]MBK9963853.1 O-methyltransferase [Holophagales bacterium]
MADTDSRAGLSYATREILDWVAKAHAPHDAAAGRAFDAPAAHGMPAIQLGPSEAKAVALLLKLAGAKKVVEVGTLAGYSALVMARALPGDGHLWTIEYEPKHARVARGNLEAAGLAGRVTVLEGAGLDVLPTLEALGPFDAVFIDADKRNYDGYGRWAAKNVRKGGLLIGDNAFLFGRLLEDSEEAAALRRFHEDAREAFDTVCLPTLDGLLIGLRR